VQPLVQEHLVYPLPPFEGPNVFSRQCEPFAFFALVRKSGVPVGLYTSGIIRHDYVNWLDLFRELHGNFPFSSEGILRATDLIFSTSAVLDGHDTYLNFR